MKLRSWDEHLGDFDLRSTTLGIGDVQEPQYQLQATAQVGIWEVNATLRSKESRGLLPIVLRATHIFWADDEGAFAWGTSTVLQATDLVGFWDQQQYSPSIARLSNWTSDNVVAASLLGSYGAICETKSRTIVVQMGYDFGLVVAVKILLDDPEGSAQVADSEHKVRQ